jgi:hypothetical protein
MPRQIRYRLELAINQIDDALLEALESRIRLLEHSAARLTWMRNHHKAGRGEEGEIRLLARAELTSLTAALGQEL